MHHHISKREKLIVMLAVMSGLLLVALDQTIVTTALGSIVTEFKSYSSLGFVVTAYLLTSTIMVPLAGKLSDMFGRRVILIIGVTTFTLASLLSGLAPSMEWLIIWRLAQGIGGGMIIANAFTIVGDLFTPRERGKWQGLIGAVFGMSSVIGPLLGGWLTDGQNIIGMTTDWRWTFFINVPVGILATILIARFCPQFKHEQKHHPDYLGAAFITIALASLVLAVDNTEVVFRTLIDQGVALSFIKGTLTVISIIAAALFIHTERRARQPIIPLRFFKVRTYSLMMIVTLLFGAAFLGAILYLTQFNQQVFGATASSAGLMLLPMVGGMMVSSIATGQIVSRIGKYKAFIVVGLSLAAVSILSLTMLQPDSPYWHEAVMMVFAGIGMGMAMPILNLAVQNEFEQKELGVATSSVQLSRGLGSTIGTALMSGLLTSGIVASLGSLNEIPYVQTLKQSPASSQIFQSGAVSADTLLIVNTQQDTIRGYAEKSFAAIPDPAVRDAQINAFVQKQDDFRTQLIKAFTESLHRIFMISSVLMAIAVVFACFVKERPLSGGVNATPGE